MNRPPRHADAAGSGFNARLALRITAVVGTMPCAYAFTALALISLPAALTTADPVIIVAWVAQTFLQLVLLSIILVGQNVSAKASDARAAATFADAEDIRRQVRLTETHLLAQDVVLERLVMSGRKHPPPRMGRGA